MQFQFSHSASAFCLQTFVLFLLYGNVIVLSQQESRRQAGPNSFPGPIAPQHATTSKNSLDDIEIDISGDNAPPPYVLSYVYLKHLAKVEETLYPLMTSYAQALEKRLRIIKK